MGALNFLGEDGPRINSGSVPARSATTIHLSSFPRLDGLIFKEPIPRRMVSPAPQWFDFRNDFQGPIQLPRDLLQGGSPLPPQFAVEAHE